ncbi:MAG: anti-sigma factor family protein [Phycisphaerae bacterium]
MGHNEISKRLSAYLDNEVSPQERALIETHLTECTLCTELLGSLRAISSMVRGYNATPLDAAFLQKLHNQVDNLSKRSVERFGWALAGIAACIALIAGIHLSLYTAPAQAATVTAPAAWEGQAVQLSANTDEAATSSNGELAMAQWMVSDLSEANRGHE